MVFCGLPRAGNFFVLTKFVPSSRQHGEYARLVPAMPSASQVRLMSCEHRRKG